VDRLQIQQVAEGITLISASRVIEAAEIETLLPSGSLYVCDAYIRGIERDGKGVPGGFCLGPRIINIDHHAPVEAMQQRISSTPLAIERVRREGAPRATDVVAINHVDADSILSAAIMRGILPLNEQFADAAIAADHTGEENDLADMLQSCGQHRSLGLSLRNLTRFLYGRALEPEAQAAFDRHRRQREEARQLVHQGKFKFTQNGVFWIYLPEKIDGVFFPSLLPQATVIVQASPLRGGKALRIGLRLGLAAPAGRTLDDLGINDFDAAYGGRWNAGNNSRAGGTAIELDDYIAKLDERVAQRF
jgi:hypothetical protein